MLNTIGKVSFEINTPGEITVIIQGSLKKAEKILRGSNKRTYVVR